MLIQQTREHLYTLRLTGLLQALEEQLAQPAMADLGSASKIAADILIDLEALAAAPFDERQQTVFRSVLARLARAKEGKVVARAVKDFRTAIHPVLVRARPYDPDDYPF